MRRTVIVILVLLTLLLTACDLSQYVPDKTGTEVAREVPRQFDSLNGYIFGVQGDVPETIAVKRAVELKLFNEPTEDPEYPIFHQMVFETYELENTGDQDVTLNLAVPALTDLRDYDTKRHELKLNGNVPSDVTTVFSDPLFFNRPEAEMGDSEVFTELLDAALSDGGTVPRALNPTLVADRPITVLRIGGLPDAELVEGDVPSYSVTFQGIDPATVTAYYFWGGSWDETSGTRMYTTNIPRRDDRMKDAYIVFFDRVPSSVEVAFFADGGLEQPLEPIEHVEEWIDTTLYEFIPELYRKDLANDYHDVTTPSGLELAIEPEAVLHLLTPYLDYLTDETLSPDAVGAFELHDIFSMARIDRRLVYELIEVPIAAGETARLDLSYELQSHYNHYGAGKDPHLLGYEIYRRTVNDIPYRETDFTLDIEADGYALLNPLADLTAESEGTRYRGIANIRQNFAVLIERQSKD